MRNVSICILVAVVATAFLAGAITASDENIATISAATARKLKVVGEVDLDDYGPVDPTPNPDWVKPGPIQHGAPMIPYIPKPSPPPPPPPPPMG